MRTVCHSGQFPAGHGAPRRPPRPAAPSSRPRRALAEPRRLSASLSPAISWFLLRNGAVWTRLGAGRPAFGGSLCRLSASFPRALLLLALPPRVCPAVSGPQKVGLPTSEFLALATRLWSGFRPSPTVPSSSFAVQHRALLREKVTFGPFGWIVGSSFFFFPPFLLLLGF